VFYEGNLVEPMHTNTALNGSIAEIEFTVRHWKIQDHDTFQANAEKITILRLGAVHHNINVALKQVDKKDAKISLMRRSWVSKRIVLRF
jgi:hypothetical protein